MPVSPPRPALPPLNALRAFEAAARLKGFRAASEELRVSAAAVSQHVRQLEAWSGVPLFERHTKGVTLTEAGARIAATLTEAFDTLGTAVADLRHAAPNASRTAPPLTLATLPSVAQLWLPGRLSALRAAMGGRQISVTALETAPNLLREAYDMSLFLAPADQGDLIAPDHVFPVCAPGIAAQISSVADLAQHVLLRDSAWASDWQDWAAAVGTRLPNAKAGPSYSLYALLLAEAKAGAGIALGHGFLIEEALADGSLVRAHAPMQDTGRALVLDLGPSFSPAERARVIAVLKRAVALADPADPD